MTTRRRRPGMRARCVDGPYAGQTFTISVAIYDKIRWSMGHGAPVHDAPVAPLVWIINGADRHCYQPRANGYGRGSWHLVYRDTF